MRGRPKIGDVIEIPTARGFAYAQLTHIHPQFGDLIRVFPGIYLEKPSHFAEVLMSEPRFTIFFPVGAAVRRSSVNIVAHEPIPEELQRFPLFRAGAFNPVLGTVNAWWLWDGDRQWQVGDLTEEQRRLPIREAWTEGLLIDRIEQDWSPGKSEDE
jgi:hypothetical protein